MATVVVVSDDAEYRGWAARDLSAVGHRVIDADRVDDALRVLGQVSVDAVVVDAGLPHDGAVRLSTRLRVESAPMPVVTVASAHAQRGAAQQGATDTVVERSRRDGALAQAVARAIDADCGFSGSVHSVSLLDMLQLMHIARRSLRIRVLAEGEGSIELVDGEVIDARHGRLEGVPALAAILGKQRGLLETSPRLRGRRTIDRPFEILLLDVMRQIDEGVPPEEIASRRTTRPPTQRASWFPNSAVRETSRPRPSTATPRLDTVESVCRTIVAGDGRALGCGLLDVTSGLLVGHVSDAAWDDAWSLAQRAATILRAAQAPAASSGSAATASPSLTEFVLSNGRSRQFSRTIQDGAAAIVLLMPWSAGHEAGWSVLAAAQAALENAAT